MSGIIKILAGHCGRFEGEGVKPDGSRFVGRLQISSVLGIQAIEIEFYARTMDGLLFHQERTTIAFSPRETICLWSINSNNPHMLQHDSTQEEVTEAGSRQAYVFGYKRPEDRTDFREEITLELWNSGEIGYQYAWGVPDNDFETRLSVKLSPEM